MLQENHAQSNKLPPYGDIVTQFSRNCTTCWRKLGDIVTTLENHAVFTWRLRHKSAYILRLYMVPVRWMMLYPVNIITAVIMNKCDIILPSKMVPTEANPTRSWVETK